MQNARPSGGHQADGGTVTPPSRLSRRHVLERAGTLAGALLVAKAPAAGAAGAPGAPGAPTGRQTLHGAKVGLTRVFPSARWTGTVGSKKVDATTNEPNSHSHASGVFAGDSFTAHWTVSPNTDHMCSTSLSGTFGKEHWSLDGTFKLAPGYLFDDGTVTGTLGGSRTVKVKARRAPGTTAAVRVTGCIGSTEIDFLVRRSRTTQSREKLTGTVDGEAVHLELEFGVDTLSIGGVWSGPVDLLAVTIGALVYFA